MRMGSSGRLTEFIMLMMVLTATATIAAAQANHSCERRCGNLSVPYPFGTREGCFLESKFFIRCDNTTDPPKAFLLDSTIDVLDIYLDGQLRIQSWVASDCYNQSGRSSNYETWLSTVPYNISYTKNKFTAIGCDTFASVLGSFEQNIFAASCTSTCDEITDVSNGSCFGLGCCQTTIARGLWEYNISVDSLNNHSDVLRFNPCSYAFIVEDGAYNFSTSDLNNSDVNRELPMILDWTIGNQNCSEAKKDPEKYACKENSYCHEPEYGTGYLCNCSNGFQGNPYVSNEYGCQDIDECETLKPCTSISTCHNSIGSFNCSCPEGYEGDGLRDGTGCSLINHPVEKIPFLQIAIGMSIGFFALFLCISWSFLVFKQRKIVKLREKYFKQNGGILLREQLSKRQGHGEMVKIFVAEELEKATDNYHESRILGQGGQGTVYKGILADGRMVAIKKSRIGDHSQVEPFVNEIIVLYQINHRNVVKLLGCCLETSVPLLVYEYVTNGSLFDHMHNVAGVASFLSWETRLRITTETAEALSYLHSAASVPIIHRDIKLANILLDENYTTKVSDFGASRLIPSDQAQVTTIVQGTFGYLDPEYMHTGQLTEKSDVYSFGVVLIELLTGQKVVCFERSEEKKVLAMYFVSLMKEDRLLDILDPRVLNDRNVKHLKEVAVLACRCVRVKGDERPTMKEVAHELAGLQAMERHPWSKSNLQTEEDEYLLGEFCSTRADDATGSSMGYDSINNQVTFEIEGAR